MFRPVDEYEDDVLRSIKAIDALLGAETIEELKAAYIQCHRERIEAFGVQMKLGDELSVVTKVTVDEYLMWAWITFSERDEREEARRDTAA